MSKAGRFPDDVLAWIAANKILGIRAYLEKYDTPGSLKYARDMGRAKSRATTTELVPV